MGRPVILSNGSLMVGLNEHGLVHDFYYPYVGLENLTNARSMHHKVGVWIDGTFSWVDDGSWNITVDFEPEALISKIVMRHEHLGVELRFRDFVDHQSNVFCRTLLVTNEGDADRTIHVFMHQVFQISRAGRGDTALYEPEENYILDYKGRYSLLIYGQRDGTPFDQFAVGLYDIEGREGTFRDAEDGELSGNPVEHGGVDSVMRLPCRLVAGASTQIDYWIVAADSQYHAERIHRRFKHDTLAVRLAQTKAHWHDWLSTGQPHLAGIPNEYAALTKKSLLIIKAHIDNHGGILASGDSSIYNYGRDYYSYVWPRDGAYALWPLIRLGYKEEAKLFFEFCRDVISEDGYLMHKYQPDRAIGSTWHPLLHKDHKELAIQEDETAIVLYMLGEYHRHNPDDGFVARLYPTLIQPAATFLAEFIDTATGLPHPSYDLWEEKFLTTTYTTAVVYQALMVAAQLAEEFGEPEHHSNWKGAAGRILGNVDRLIDADTGVYHKGFLLEPDGKLTVDTTLDVSSAYGVMMYGLYEGSQDVLATTIKRIEEVLLDKSPSGGLPRYANDNYFQSDPPFLGNPWFVATLWLAQYYIRTQKTDKARRYVEWVLANAYPSGVLAEQINPTSAAPLSVAPLVWSHAEFINTVLDLIADADDQPWPAATDSQGSQDASHDHELWADTPHRGGDDPDPNPKTAIE